LIDAVMAKAEVTATDRSILRLVMVLMDGRFVVSVVVIGQASGGGTNRFVRL
jgi:hypothetical protein